MSEEFTRSKPVETLLCGPAASVAGGMTSDISIVKDGIPSLASEGATVSKWRMGIKSILISTIGLGGDSLIRHVNNSRLSIGPMRAAPLSRTSAGWPEVSSEIKEIHERLSAKLSGFRETHDVYIDSII